VTDTDREFLRTTFGQDAALYDQARTRYPEQPFEDLAELAGLGPGSRVLEIGCGTGQATLPLARLGCTIVAVELSPEMAAVARHNLRDFPNVTVEVAAFEDWTPPAEPFDLVLAATAFHWVDPDVRFTKSADVLRPGGTLATIFNEHVAGGTEKFFVDAQGCYERFDPSTPPGLRQTPAADIPDDSTEFDGSRRFGPVTFRRYAWEQEYRTRAYMDLLLTYSGHRAMPPPAREGLLACLADLIDRDHGGRISKAYLTRLTLAHTPYR
jgi:SAM-dependent methyltransferase